MITRQARAEYEREERRTRSYIEAVALFLSLETGHDVSFPQKLSDRFAQASDLSGIPGWSFRLGTSRRISLSEDLDLAEQGRRDDGAEYCAAIQWALGEGTADSYAVMTLGTFAALLRSHSGAEQDSDAALLTGADVLPRGLATRTSGFTFRAMVVNFLGAALGFNLEDIDGVPHWSFATRAAHSFSSWALAFEAGRAAAQEDGHRHSAIIFNRDGRTISDAVVGMPLHQLADLIGQE